MDSTAGFDELQHRRDRRGRFAPGAVAAPDPAATARILGQALSHPDGMEPNDTKAERAGRALAAYADEAFPGGGEDTATAMTDLLVDLRHLADQYGVPFDDLADRSARRYDAEIHGDDLFPGAPPAAGGDPDRTWGG